MIFKIFEHGFYRNGLIMIRGEKFIRFNTSRAAPTN